MDKARLLVDALTVVHGLGSVAVFGMAAYILANDGDAEPLATTPGARQLIDWTGPFLPVFFVALGLFLGFLAWGSHHRHHWSWPAAVCAYSIGVLGSLAELVAGHGRYFASLLVNGAVLAALLSPPVRKAFRGEGKTPVEPRVHA